MYRQAWVTAAALAMSVLASGSGLATPAWAPLAGKNIRVEYRVTETSKVTTSGKLAGKTARETKVQVCKERNNYYVSDEGRIFWSVLLIACDGEKARGDNASTGAIYSLDAKSGVFKNMSYKSRSTPGGGIELTIWTAKKESTDKDVTSSRYEWKTTFTPEDPCRIKHSGTGLYFSDDKPGPYEYDYRSELVRKYDIVSCTVSEGHKQ